MDEKAHKPQPPATDLREATEQAGDAALEAMTPDLPYDPLAHYGPKPQAEKRAYIKQLYEAEGLTMNQIAERVGVVRESVRQILHKAGADIRPRGGVTGTRRRSR